MPAHGAAVLTDRRTHSATAFFSVTGCTYRDTGCQPDLCRAAVQELLTRGPFCKGRHFSGLQTSLHFLVYTSPGLTCPARLEWAGSDPVSSSRGNTRSWLGATRALTSGFESGPCPSQSI